MRDYDYTDLAEEHINKNLERMHDITHKAGVPITVLADVKHDENGYETAGLMCGTPADMSPIHFAVRLLIDPNMRQLAINALDAYVMTRLTQNDDLMQEAGVEKVDLLNIFRAANLLMVAAGELVHSFSLAEAAVTGDAEMQALIESSSNEKMDGTLANDLRKILGDH